MRIDSDIAEAAFGSADLGIGLNSLLYVIQNLESKSLRKLRGHPFSYPASLHVTDEKLLDADSGGVSGALLGGDVAVAVLSLFRFPSSRSFSISASVASACTASRVRRPWFSWYDCPRHQTGVSSTWSFAGSGSQNICTIFL